jgi:hypothetical protein
LYLFRESKNSQTIESKGYRSGSIVPGGQKRHNPGNFVRNVEIGITGAPAATKQASQGSYGGSQDSHILRIICHDSSDAATGKSDLAIKARIGGIGNHFLLPGGKGFGIKTVFTGVLVTFGGAGVLVFSVTHLSKPP